MDSDPGPVYGAVHYSAATGSGALSIHWKRLLKCRTLVNNITLINHSRAKIMHRVLMMLQPTGNESLCQNSWEVNFFSSGFFPFLRWFVLRNVGFSHSVLTSALHSTPSPHSCLPVSQPLLYTYLMGFVPQLKHTLIRVTHPPVTTLH